MHIYPMQKNGQAFNPFSNKVKRQGGNSNPPLHNKLSKRSACVIRPVIIALESPVVGAAESSQLFLVRRGLLYVKRSGSLRQITSVKNLTPQ